MAATGPEDGSGAGPRGAGPRGVGPRGAGVCAASPPTHSSTGPDLQNLQNLNLQQNLREAERGWTNMAAPLGPTMHLGGASTPGEAPYSFCSPESVEMDEIMAAMVLTSLSCSPALQSPALQSPALHSPALQSPALQSPAHTDPGPGGSSSSSADMECGGGELSDSGSSGYWSWDHGNVSPAPSTSVTEVDSSPDEGLHMELEPGEELHAKKPKSCFRGVYRCLWPSCGKVLTSSVGIKRHVRVLHLSSSGSDQSQREEREEDFYFTRVSCDSLDPGPAPPATQQAPPTTQQGQAPPPQLGWASCGSPPASGLQIPPAHRPRSNSSSGPRPCRPGPLSQSAPSSFWQIHSEHLYQACSPVQVSVAPRSPGCQGWTPSASGPGHSNTPVVKARCRSVSVGEQWLQQNRLQPLMASPSRSHCSFRKGRGEAKKCRKVYGVERKDQWCTACRWKKACQRFPD